MLIGLFTVWDRIGLNLKQILIHGDNIVTNSNEIGIIEIGNFDSIYINIGLIL